jgi:UDP-3-O-[3-hydroxymyristoyl] glucosamine N-acyltransferase
MSISVVEIADFVSAKITGDNSLVINSLLNIENAEPGSLTFLGSRAYEKFLPLTKASAILVNIGFLKERPDMTYIEVENPYKSFLLILERYFVSPPELEGIDTSASLHPTVIVEESASIGKNVVIGRNCYIGKDVKIFHNTVILENCRVGDNTIIYPNVSVRENCQIGNNVIIHNGASIGADGFGFIRGANGKYDKIPQIGNVIIEGFVEIGANSCIDRAALGSTIIRAYTKIDNLVQIGHNVEIGNNTAISAQSGVAGSTKVGDNVIIAGQVGIVDHIEIADGVIIGAQAGVSRNLNDKGIYVGSPVKNISQFKRIEVHIRNLGSLNDQVKSLQEQVNNLQELLEKKETLS